MAKTRIRTGIDGSQIDPKPGCGQYRVVCARAKTGAPILKEGLL